MKQKYYIPLVIIGIAAALTGLVLTQVSWLKKSVKTAEQQYNDRADRMLGYVHNELLHYNDTSIRLIKPASEIGLYDAIDTNLLDQLLNKYSKYQRLDTVYCYALVRSHDQKVLYQKNGFTPDMEDASSKLCLSCIWKKEYIHLSVFFPDKRKNIYMSMYTWFSLSVAFTIIILAIFIFVVHNLIRQKKISEIRNDFINNMTHEFKTPISTISLASEMLIRDKSSDKGRVKKYSQIIFDENKRMQAQVELVLQTALIERQKIKLKRTSTNLHELIENVVSSFNTELAQKQASFHYELHSLKAHCPVDPAHIRNVISNLIDNAIKYSGSSPKIELKTKDTSQGLMLCVCDNGIGMSREAQKHVFEKFYRVSTGNVHNVKGFGLGLYYVKMIVEAHFGSVRVESTPNKGSSFFIVLPDCKK